MHVLIITALTVDTHVFSLADQTPACLMGLDVSLVPPRRSVDFPVGTHDSR